jgi:hypothetical protein
MSFAEFVLTGSLFMLVFPQQQLIIAAGVWVGAIACCWKLVKDTNDRLDEALIVLEEESLEVHHEE